MTMQTRPPTAEELKAFVQIHAHQNQTSLVLLLLESVVITHDDIRNLYVETPDGGEDEQDITEWIVVSSKLLETLEALGQPVLISDLGSWWGRMESGHDISEDKIIKEAWLKMQ